MITLGKHVKSNAHDKIDEAKAAGKALALDPSKDGGDARRERSKYGNKLQGPAFDEGFKEGVKELTDSR